jgi:hypothetical protein
MSICTYIYIYVLKVHLAKLNGKKVAVKVQHPNLTERLDVDMSVLRWFAYWAGDRVGQTVDQFACNFQAQVFFMAFFFFFSLVFFLAFFFFFFSVLVVFF